MKKTILIMLLFFPLLLNAECDYKSKKELSELSIYIDYSYEYNEDTEKFDLTIYNLQNLFYVDYKGNNDVNDGTTVINGFNYGSNISINIKGTGISNCPIETFRIINIDFPYLNQYYKSDKCKEHQNLSVCYSRFLNFEVTSEIFKNALKKESEIKKENNDNNTSKILTSIFTFFKENYIKILLVVTTSVVWILIYKNKYRKSKHGF